MQGACLNNIKVSAIMFGSSDYFVSKQASKQASKHASIYLTKKQDWRVRRSDVWHTVLAYSSFRIMQKSTVFITNATNKGNFQDKKEQKEKCAVNLYAI